MPTDLNCVCMQTGSLIGYAFMVLAIGYAIGAWLAVYKYRNALAETMLTTAHFRMRIQAFYAGRALAQQLALMEQLDSANARAIVVKLQEVMSEEEVTKK